MMSKYDWKFYKYEDDEIERNSSSGKHFNDAKIASSLIRELVQNSLDAAKDDGLVNIKIRCIELDLNQCMRYVKKLRPHYTASYKESMPLGDNGKIPFLIVEDFNTTGLTPSKEKDFLFKDNTRNDDSSSGGSHGIGKVVFYMASNIKTFFAYSFSEDNTETFAGTCDFISHKIGGEHFKEDGKLTLSTKKDHSFIDALFTRTKGEHGLSIAIPIPNDNLDTNILKAAIEEECYYPIIRKKLTIDIDGHRIDGNYILDLKGEKQQLISRYMTNPETTVSIEIGKQYASGTLKDTVLTADEEQQITAKLKEDHYVVIEFKFLIHLKKTGEWKEASILFLLSEKKEKNRGGFDFWRENILIKGHSKQNSSNYIAIVLIDHHSKELGNLLRKLENPSHTKWEYQSSSNEIKTQYSYINKLVPFITQLPHKVINQIHISNFNVDSDFFSDFFPDTTAGSKGSSRGKKPSGGQIPIGLEHNHNVSFREKNNGFILSLSDEGKQKNISKIDIEVAYGTNKGDPFKHYDIQDFRVDTDIQIDLKNGTTERQQENHLSCEVCNNDFQISLSGFDPNRELIVKFKEQVEE